MRPHDARSRSCGQTEQTGIGKVAVNLGGRCALSIHFSQFLQSGFCRDSSVNLAESPLGVVVLASAAAAQSIGKGADAGRSLRGRCL